MTQAYLQIAGLVPVISLRPHAGLMPVEPQTGEQVFENENQPPPIREAGWEDVCGRIYRTTPRVPRALPRQALGIHEEECVGGRNLPNDCCEYFACKSPRRSPGRTLAGRSLPFRRSCFCGHPLRFRKPQLMSALRYGNTLNWDTRLWKVINVGNASIGLLSEDQKVVEPPLTAIDTSV
jgi:hypothetical protein